MSISTFIENGGIIVYILIFLNIIGFSLIITKIINIFQMNSKKDTIINNVFDIIIQNKSKQQHLDNLIQNELKSYEFGLNTIRTIATISPLLGLLGTVLGIFLSFDTISKVGLDDPTLFSSSISLALITTVVGLIVAIPHYIFYNYYIGILNKNELEISTKVLEKI